LSSETQAKTKVLQFATLLVALVPVYNVAGLSRPLKFSPQALAGIYLGTITRWNDHAIAAANPEVQLPANEIVVVHSASGRGSTYVWSDYLSKVSTEWRAKVGRGIDIEWPVGREAQGNGNLAKMVKATPNAIGYVELMNAERSGLARGEVQNGAGNYITADPESIKDAALAARPSASEFRASITNAPGENAYPIASFTWILISESAASNSKREALKDFLRWALKQGQGYVEPSGFTRLPAAIAEQELKALEKLP
jgi:phosphate transport system substrate-binding protein